jgi:hypothetical protein
MKEKIKNFNFMGIFMLVLTAVLGIVDGSAVMAMAAVTTTPSGSSVMTGDPTSVALENQGMNTVTTDNLSPELLEETLSNEIVKIRPTNTPLDTIIRHGKSRPAEGWVYSWYSADVRPVSTSVTSYVPSGNGAALVVGDATLFAESDTVRVVPDISTGVAEVFYVATVNYSTNTLDLAYADANNAQPAPSLTISASNTPTVYRLGRAAIEGEVQTINYSAYPSKESNHCQIFKYQVAQSTLDKIHKKEINWTLSDVEEQAMYEFKLAQEASFLFGKRCKYFNLQKQMPVYTTGGIINYITKNFTFNTQNGASEFIDLAEQVFQGNVGNRKRVMFMGSGFNAAMSKIDVGDKQVMAKETEIVWGLEFNTIRTNFGTLMAYQHDLFDLYGFKDKAIILDVDNIDKYVWRTEMLELDTKKSGSFDGDVKVFTEICGVALRYPDTHCIVHLQ